MSLASPTPPKTLEGQKDQTCSDCCMVLEPGVECICCSVSSHQALDEKLFRVEIRMATAKDVLAILEQFYIDRRAEA